MCAAGDWLNRSAEFSENGDVQRPNDFSINFYGFQRYTRLWNPIAEYIFSIVFFLHSNVTFAVRLEKKTKNFDFKCGLKFYNGKSLAGFFSI